MIKSGAACVLACALVVACDGGVAAPGVGAVDGGPAVTPSDGAFVDGWSFSPCDQAGHCDDGLGCTIDSCDEAGVCRWSLVPGTCLLGGTCFLDGQADPANPCRQCDAAVEATVWTPLPGGTPCDGGGPCNESICELGICALQAATCDDGDPCTEDACDAEGGCSHEPLGEGTACDDGSSCTTQTTCAQGACVGVPMDCDDGEPCTDDGCTEDEGCVYFANVAPCDDGDPCTDGDVCSTGQCVSGDAALCDDGNQCTLDHCDAVAGCVHLPTQSPCCLGMVSVCDDANPCTDDACDPATADCEHTFHNDPCDDGNACSAGDVCTDGACMGSATDCSDGNSCTQDQCAPDLGCVWVDLADAAGCDDGLACSVGDHCESGACVADTSACTCVPDLEVDISKISKLLIGDGGHPGQGLDLDGDPSTCAPAGDCSAGVDNALGLLASFANEPLENAVSSGDLMLSIGFHDLVEGLFTLGLSEIDLAPENLSCDTTTAVCDYLVDKSSLDPVTCGPLISMPGQLVGNSVTAGGPGNIFPFALPLDDGVVLEVAVYDARFVGTVVQGATGITAVEGILAGAIPKEILVATVQALPEEGLPIDKSLILAVVEVLDVDMDTAGDGIPDASSVALVVTGIDGFLVGVKD